MISRPLFCCSILNRNVARDGILVKRINLYVIVSKYLCNFLYFCCSFK